MSNEYIAFEMHGGKETVVVAVKGSDVGQVTVSRAAEKPTLAEKTFEAALENIRPVIETIVEKIHGLSDKVNEIEVEFGVGMHAKVGVVIVSGDVDTNFKVRLKIKRV